MGKFDGLISEYPLGERVRYYRKEAGLTQTELAKRCDLSQTSIALLEKSQLMCTVGNLKKISEILGIHIATLFAEDEVFVFDMKKIRRYKNRSNLPPSIRNSLGEVMKFAAKLKD